MRTEAASLGRWLAVKRDICQASLTQRKPGGIRDDMAQLFASGRIIDLILLLLVVQTLALALWNQRTGRGIPPGELLGFLLAGACLMLALRTALTGGHWRMVALWLALAGVAQAFDLWRRWR
jgi:hypothetical protein